MSNFKLGEKSLKELQGVHPNLVEMVKMAIERTPVDFAVHDGLRTPNEQNELFVMKASKTRDSKHLLQESTGYGHAVDLVPYFNGRLRWEWNLIYPIATQMRAAAEELGVRVRWGGVWDKCLNDLYGPLDLHVKAYCERHPGPDFIDGPHYELMGVK